MAQAQAAARHPEAADRAFGGGIGTASPDPGDVARRIAFLVGEIDALKQERRVTSALGARAALATPYFRKRPARA